MKPKAKSKDATRKKRLADAVLAGTMFGEMLIENWSERDQTEEMADAIDTRISGSGERATKGQMVLTKTEMKVAVEKVCEYIRAGAPHIIKAALGEFCSNE